MNCWHCERPAHGVCRFCGRGVCKDHVKEMPYIISFYRSKKEALNAVVVNNVLFCGVCQPGEDPVAFPELDGETKSAK